MEPEAYPSDDRIDMVCQWAAVLGNKIGLLEQRLAYIESQIAKINQNFAVVDERLEEMDKKVTARDAQLDGHDTLWLYVRASELEKIWFKVTGEVDDEDIYISHGADVALDIQALKYLEETDELRFESAQFGFEHLYGFSFDENEERVLNAPREVRGTINMRANLKFLRSWKYKSSMTGYLVDVCDGILKRWGNKQNYYYPNAQLRQEYAELEESHKCKGED